LYQKLLKSDNFYFVEIIQVAIN